MENVKKIVLKQETIQLGFGSTARTTVLDNYYQVEETEDRDQVSLRLLNINDEPFGKAEVISRDQLDQEYTPCPDYFQNKQDPNALVVDKYVANGEKHYEQRELYSAEHQFNKALSLNGDDLRANLGKGKTLFARGEKQEAIKVFQHLSQIDNLYKKENKHTFNEFGIELRKRHLLQEAIANYHQAQALDPEDAVILYNLGRAYFEQGDTAQALNSLKKALAVQADFQEARDFIAFLEETGGGAPGPDRTVR